MTESDRCCRYDPKKTCRQPKRIGCNFCSQTCQDHSDIQDAINAEWQRFTTQVGIKIARNRMDSEYMFDLCEHQNDILSRILNDIDGYNIRVEKGLIQLDKSMQQILHLDAIVDQDEISRLQSLVDMITEDIDNLRTRIQNASNKCKKLAIESLHNSILAIQWLALENNEKVFDLEGERRIKQSKLKQCKKVAKATPFNTVESIELNAKIEQLTVSIQELDNEIEFAKNKYSSSMCIANDKYRTVLFVDYVLNTLE